MQNVCIAGLWTAKGGGGPIDPKIGYKAGCGVWLVCCLIGMGWLLGQGLGAISTRYFAYLCAQAVLAVGVIMELPGTQFSCFTSTTVQIRTPEALRARHLAAGHAVRCYGLLPDVHHCCVAGTQFTPQFTCVTSTKVQILTP